MALQSVRCPRCGFRVGYVVERPFIDPVTGRETPGELLDIRITLGIDPPQEGPLSEEGDSNE